MEKVKEMVMNDRRITIREVADDVGISIGSCHEIFADALGIKHAAAKFVPKLLNFLQKFPLFSEHTPYNTKHLLLENYNILRSMLKRTGIELHVSDVLEILRVSRLT